MHTNRASNIDVKRLNRINTLRCLLECERISQPELAQRLPVSWPTVLQNVKELTALGLIREVGAYASTGGRKARAFSPVRDARVALGLDITKNHISLVLVDLSGRALQLKRIKKPFSSQEAYFVSLGNLTRAFMEESGYLPEKLLGVGVSLPGIMDEDGHTLCYSHALGVRDLSVSFFSRNLPGPCAFINDANAAGLAELRDQPAASHTVYLSLSNSVGGAILFNGALYKGDNLRAGEFGHTTLVPDGKRCYCGKRGCVDAYCCALTLSSHTQGNLPRFFHLLSEGQADLQPVFHDYLRMLAICINNLRMTFDCDVILGGYVGAYMEPYMEQLRPMLAQRNTFEPDAAYVKLCRYRQEASAVGAALLLIDRFIEQI